MLVGVALILVLLPVTKVSRVGLGNLTIVSDYKNCKDVGWKDAKMFSDSFIFTIYI